MDFARNVKTIIKFKSTNRLILKLFQYTVLHQERLPSFYVLKQQDKHLHLWLKRKTNKKKTSQKGVFMLQNIIKEKRKVLKEKKMLEIAKKS